MLKFTKIMIFAIIYVIVNICATLLYGFLIGGYPSVLFYLIIGIISLGMIIFLDKKIIKIEKYRAFVRVTHLVFITYKMINFLVTFERFSLPLGEI